MARRDDRYVQAIDGKKIPILTLDQKWHRLFTQTGVSAEIRRKEEPAPAPKDYGFTRQTFLDLAALDKL